MRRALLFSMVALAFACSPSGGMDAMPLQTDATSDVVVSEPVSDASVEVQDVVATDAPERNDVAANTAPVIPSTPGLHTVMFTHQGLTRRFLLSIPRNYQGTSPTPLVLVFHGNNQHDVFAAMMYGVLEETESRGWIAVFGDGLDRPGEPGGSWNAFACCSFARVSNSDDVGYVRTIMSAVESTLRVDARRIYATGFSNGAMFTHRLGVELGARLAAIAPVAGCLSGVPAGATMRVSVPPAARRLPVFAVHGRNDGIVPFEGGMGDVARFDSEADSMAYWAMTNGCRTDPTITIVVPGVQRHLYENCADGTTVQLMAVNDGTHRYGLLDPHGMTTARAVCDFFARHMLP